MSASRPAKWRACAARTSSPSPPRRVAPRRTGGSSPTSKTGSAPRTGRRPAATCAPARPADQARRSHRGHRIRPPRRRCAGRIRPRTPNTAPTATSRRRRAGRRTTPPRGAACGGVPGRAVTRPAAGTADRDDRAPRSAVIDAIREAASSIASGIPSRRRQISTTAAASSALASEKRGATLRARSTNRLTAAESMPAPTSSEGTGHNCSSATPNPSRLVAKILHRRGLRQDGLDQISGGVAHMLAVVQHQQPDPALQRGGHGLAHALARLLGDAQHRRHRIGHRSRVGDRGQFEKPDAVGELIGHPRRDLGRQPGLADPAHPGQRHQPMACAARLAPRRPRSRAQ